MSCLKKTAPIKKEKSAAIDFLMALVGGVFLLFTAVNEWSLYNNLYGREVRQPSGLLESGEFSAIAGAQTLEDTYRFWNSGGMIALRLILLFAGIALCAAGLIRLVHLCQRKRWIAYVIISVIGVLLVIFGIVAEVYMMENPEGIVLLNSQTSGELAYQIDVNYNEHLDWASAQGTMIRLGYWLLSVFTAAAGSIGAARSRFRNTQEDAVDTQHKRQELLKQVIEENNGKK